MTPKEILILILAEESGVSSDKILDTSRLGKDLGIGNTVGRAEFLGLKEDIEKAFGIKIPPEAIPSSDEAKDVTVGEIVELLDSLLSN
ncbi:MAG: hypothetical protein V1704_01425 [Candidatus Vogelbacteria bacterium]